MVHQSESPLIHLESIIKPMRARMIKAGFESTHTMQFPQPCYPTGWWSATMAAKNLDLTKFREQEALAISDTRYYNAGIHQASLLSPNLLKQ